MSLSWLRQHRGRVLRWGLLALALAGVAWALHTWLPPPPRWTEAGDCADVAFSPDGERVLTVSRDSSTNEPCAPVRLRDTATGRTMFALATELTKLLAQQPSADFGQWVGVGLRASDRRPHLVTADLTTGAQRYTPLEIPGKHGMIVGSNPHCPPPAGLVSVVTGPHDPNDTHGFRHLTIHFFDAQTGEHVASLPSSGLAQCTADGRYFVHEYEPLPGRRMFGVWDVRTRRSGPAIDAGKSSEQVYVGPDCRTLYVVSTNAPERYNVTLWDLPTATRRAVLKREAAQRLDMAPDGRRFAITGYARQRPAGPDDVVASICDVQTGLNRIDVPVRTGADARLSPDGRLLFLVDLHAGQTRCRMFDVDERRTRWEAAWPGSAAPWSDSPYVRFFGEGGDRLIVANPRTALIEILDARTGESQARLTAGLPPGLENTGGPPKVRGRYLYNCCHLMLGRDVVLAPKSNIRQWLESWLPLHDDSADISEMVQIVDVPAGRAVFRITLAMGGRSWLSPDGTALLVREEVNGEPEIRCYAIPAQKPLYLVAGIPLVIGVLVLSLRFAWHQWGGKRAGGP